MINNLAIVDTNEDAKNHPYSISAEQLGAPDQKVFKERLIKFFNTPPNQQYIYAWQSYLTNSDLEAILRQVLTEIYLAFGTYRDSLQGLENQFKNLKLIEQRGSFIAEITNPTRFFIVGAGPSLDNEIETLREIKKNKYGFIICVDASLKKLLDNRIRPDLVVTTERVEDTKPFLKGIPFPQELGLHVLASLVAYPETLSQLTYSYTHFFIRSFPEQEWLDLGLNPLPTTPFVTQTCTMFAIQQGFKEIVLVGQDFAYGPNGESHAYVGHDHIETKETNGIEVESVTGEKVLTSYYLNIFAQDLEQIIEKYSPQGIQFVNTSKTGRLIKGAMNLNLSAIGFKEMKENAIVSYKIPGRYFHLRERIAKAITYLEKLPPINPEKISDYEDFSDLGYSLIIQPWVAYMSNAFQDPEKKESYLEMFQNTANQVKIDLIRILKEYLSGN